MQNSVKSIVCASASMVALAVAAPAAAADATPRLHPTKAACVEYQLSGQMQNGTTIRCHRDYAYEQYEIQNTTVGFGGMTQTQNQHTITIGEWIYAIDLTTNTGTKTQNPLYANLVSALDNTSPEDMADAFMSAMGMTATSETKTVAGETCTVYSSQMMGTVCMTGGGLMLEQSFMGNSQVATSVSIGNGGDDANYKLHENVPITDGPNIGAIMDMLNSGQ